MPDILNNAVGGLLAFQRALSVTSHNIANVNTPGYSRQSAEIGANTPSMFGGVFYGNGVEVESISRAYDQFLTREVRSASSTYARASMFAQLSGHVDDVLGDPQSGISPMLHNFFEAVQSVADDPSSSTARNNMINAAESLTARFQSTENRFEVLQENTNDLVRSKVDEINSLVTSIRDINSALDQMSATGSGNQQAADLLDQRDQMLEQLATKIDITVINEQENQLSIFVGNGQAILSGNETFTLRAQASLNDPTQDVIIYEGLVSVFDLSDKLTGGELGGLIDFRDQVLQPARNALGRTAIGLAETFNAQMRDGMDLNGNLGQDFFSYTPPQSIAHASNVGSATVSTVVSDVNGLTIDDYELNFNGTDWTLTSASGNSASVANGAPATLTLDGLTLTIEGATAVAGDEFLIKPTLAGAAALQVSQTDPTAIAAALPIRSNASLMNLGSLAISPGVVSDVTHPNLLNTVNFTFDDPPATFRVDADVVVDGVAYVAGAAIAFSNNMTVESNGWQVSLEGAPAAGDALVVESNQDGTGDNRNALNLANLQNIGIFDGGNANYQEAYGALVGTVGAKTFSAQIEADAQQMLRLQAAERRSSKVSVNLDEEAVDLVRYQQAYEAAARIIATAQEMFDAMINMSR